MSKLLFLSVLFFLSSTSFAMERQKANTTKNWEFVNVKYSPTIGCYCGSPLCLESPKFKNACAQCSLINDQIIRYDVEKIRSNPEGWFLEFLKKGEKDAAQFLAHFPGLFTDDEIIFEVDDLGDFFAEKFDEDSYDEEDETQNILEIYHKYTTAKFIALFDIEKVKSELTSTLKEQWTPETEDFLREALQHNGHDIVKPIQFISQLNQMMGSLLIQHNTELINKMNGSHYWSMSFDWNEFQSVNAYFCRAMHIINAHRVKTLKKVTTFIRGTKPDSTECILSILPKELSNLILLLYFASLQAELS